MPREVRTNRYHKGQTSPNVISHCLYSLSKVILAKREKAHWHPSLNAQVKHLGPALLPYVLPLPGGIHCLEQGLATAETHTSHARRGKRADTVPKGRACSPHPGLVNLGPLCSLQCCDLPVWKHNCLLRGRRDTGVTQTPVLYTSISDDTASQQRGLWQGVHRHAEPVIWERSSIHKPEIHVCNSAVKRMRVKSSNMLREEGWSIRNNKINCSSHSISEQNKA